MPTTYYKIRGSRVTVAEYRRMFPGTFSFALAVMMKPFGGISFPAFVSRMEALNEVEWDDLPRIARDAFQEPFHSFERSGFDFLFCYKIPVLARGTYSIAAISVSEDGLMIAMANFVKEMNRRDRASAVATFYDDGTMGFTTTGTGILKSRPNFRIQRLPGATAFELCAAHRRQMTEWAERSRPVKLNAQQVREKVLETEQSIVDFQIERGVYVRVPDEDVERIRKQIDKESRFDH